MHKQMPTKLKIAITRKAPLLFVFLIVVVLWLLFYPAYMSADSLVQYGQAVSGVYEDWHPPIMAVTLHYILLLGGSISTITFLQTVSGCFGIYALGKEILIQRNATEKKIKWVPLYILLILILPVSPLPFYLMTFLKDTWVLIGLIWIGYIGLRTCRIQNKTSRRYAFNYLVLVISMALLCITRYNAVVLLPVFFFILFYNSKRLSKATESIVPLILWALVPFFLYLTLQNQLQKAFDIKKMHPENQVMALESVGAILCDENTAMYVPYVQRNLTADYKGAYYPGNVASVMSWEGSKKTLNQQTFSIIDDRIKKEYIQLALHAPFVLLKVKLEGFYNMLKPSTQKYWYHIQLDDNPYGLVQNEFFKKARLGWQRLADNIHRISITSFIGSEHIVWLIVNLVLLISLFVKKKMRSMLSIILLLSLGYYISYLLACTGDDFRFMYPATLLVQVVALSLAFSRPKLESVNINRSSEAS